MARQEELEDAQWAIIQPLLPMGGGHGVYTYHLIEGLKGKADFDNDGIVRLGELAQYVSDQVRRDTKSQQSPIPCGSYDVNMPLTVLPGKKWAVSEPNSRLGFHSSICPANLDGKSEEAIPQTWNCLFQFDGHAK